MQLARCVRLKSRRPMAIFVMLYSGRKTADLAASWRYTRAKIWEQEVLSIATSRPADSVSFDGSSNGGRTSDKKRPLILVCDRFDGDVQSGRPLSWSRRANNVSGPLWYVHHCSKLLLCLTILSSIIAFPVLLHFMSILAAFWTPNRTPVQNGCTRNMKATRKRINKMVSATESWRHINYWRR